MHIVDLVTGAVEGSLTWPAGDQIFAIDWIDATPARASSAATVARGGDDAAWYTFRPFGDELADVVEEG